MKKGKITLNSKKEGNSAEWTYGVNEKGAKIKEVKLNGQNVPVEKNGTYSAKNLAEGENTLEVTAEDKEGNITKKTNTVLIDTKAPELTVSSKVNGNSSEWTYATDKDSKIKGSIFILFGDVVLTIDMPDERLSRFNAIGEL